MSILPVRRGLARIVASLLVGLLGSGVTQAQTDPEAAAWSQARKANTVDAYQDYLSLYPLGAHSQDAFGFMIRLSQIEDISPAAGGLPPQEVLIDEPDQHEPDPPDQESDQPY